MPTRRRPPIASRIVDEVLAYAALSVAHDIPPRCREYRWRRRHVRSTPSHTVRRRSGSRSLHRLRRIRLVERTAPIANQTIIAVTANGLNAFRESETIRLMPDDRRA